MKIFTLEEANSLLRKVQPVLLRIRDCHQTITSARETAKSAADSAKFGGGGMEGGSIYVSSIYELNELTAELDDLGVQIKDYSRGLIDFPAMRENRVVLLCWQLGEGDKIEWWHDIDAGFVGRQRL